MAEIKMCWIDMETTGLDPYVDVPLELGLKLSDEYGFVVAEKSWIVWEPSQDWSIAMMHGAAHKIVGPMHEKSGLWDDIMEQRGKTTKTRSEADEEVMDWLDEQGVTYGELPMCGSSIGSLDRPFANVHFPEFSSKGLNYRNVDVSSLKEICKLLNPVLFENLKPIIGSKEDAVHRVLEDIDASILEYRAYIENFLIEGGD